MNKSFTGAKYKIIDSTGKFGPSRYEVRKAYFTYNRLDAHGWEYLTNTGFIWTAKLAIRNNKRQKPAKVVWEGK